MRKRGRSSAGRHCGQRPRNQARRRDVGDGREHGLVHELPKVHALAQTGLMNAEAARQELVAAQGTRRSGDLAFEHDAAQGLLGGIVGGRQRWVRRERPQCRPQLEDVGAGLGRAWCYDPR